MIKVVVFRKNKEILGFEISGHANSGPYGYDLVCAGVSAVSFGAINAVFELTDVEPIINQAGEKGGYLQVMLPSSFPNEKHQQVQLILETMIVSLRTIERDYRKFITIQDGSGGAFKC